MNPPVSSSPFAPRPGGVPTSTGTYPAAAEPPPPAAPMPASGGGRFIGRTRLALGAGYWLAWLAFSRRSSVGSGVQREIQALGLGALRLVLGASFLVGLIATFQLAYQLKQFGAEPMSAKAIGWFGAREFGPLVAALLVVARSASAIAGEFASMSANAEIDALRAMGLDPVKYLVAPKLGALLLTLPALTILSDALIAVGGYVGMTGFLGYSSGVFVEQFQSSLAVRDIVIGLGKSVVFAVTVSVVSADQGLNVERNVAAIGGAATRSVVYCLIGVLGADTLVNAVFYFIPGLV